MGNCATKPKVLKDSDETPAPVPDPAPAPAPAPAPVVAAMPEKHNEDENAVEVAEARRRDKGKEIMIEEGDDDEEGEDQLGHKCHSLSHLINEEEQKLTMRTEKNEPEPMNQETDNQTGLSLESPKPPQEFSFVEVSELKLPEVSTEFETSRTIPTQQTDPQSPDFVDAQGNTEPMSVMTIPSIEKQQNSEKIIFSAPTDDNSEKIVPFVEMPENYEKSKESIVMPELGATEVNADKKTDAEYPEATH